MEDHLKGSDFIHSTILNVLVLLLDEAKRAETTLELSGPFSLYILQNCFCEAKVVFHIKTWTPVSDGPASNTGLVTH